MTVIGSKSNVGSNSYDCDWEGYNVGSNSYDCD